MHCLYLLLASDVYTTVLFLKLRRFDQSCDTISDRSVVILNVTALHWHFAVATVVHWSLCHPEDNREFNICDRTRSLYHPSPLDN